MSERYLATLPTGILAVIQLQGKNDAYELSKIMFQLSFEMVHDPVTGIDSVVDPTEHFDPKVHTLAAIAKGIPNHFPLACQEVPTASLPYHINGNGDPGHGMCFDPDCHDRYFRDACVFDGTAVAINMSKARVLHMDKIRVVRNAELAAKDITFMRAVEAGDTDAQSTIGTEKQVLRDIPATFDITTDVDTPEKLKGKWPTELPARE